MIADLISDVYKKDVSDLSHPAEHSTACQTASQQQVSISGYVKSAQPGVRVMLQADQEQADFELAHLASIIDEL